VDGEAHLAEVHSEAADSAVALEVGPSVEEVPQEAGNSKFIHEIQIHFIAFFAEYQLPKLW
jgi:ABC-type glutathione transport system ATPase component